MAVTPAHGSVGSAFSAEEIATMVVAARGRMTATARSHPRFAGLSAHDVDDLFDETSEIVVRRHDRYESPDHVDASIWRGMEMRALDRFRRRRRRGPEPDPQLLDLLVDDEAPEIEDRVAGAQMLSIVEDFLAALAPREAAAWRLVTGDDLSVSETAARLEVSRHAVELALDAAERKLELFASLHADGVWCGRRRADIARAVDGAHDEGTLRRARAHLDACAACRRAHARLVRGSGRLAGAVLPAPLITVASGESAGVLDRLLDLLPGLGGGGRVEVVTGTIAALGGGSAAVTTKVGVAVLGTVAVAGAGTAALAPGERSAPPARTAERAGTAPRTTPASSPVVMGTTAPVSRTVTARPRPAVAPRPSRRTEPPRGTTGPGVVVPAPPATREPVPRASASAPAPAPPPAPAATAPPAPAELGPASAPAVSGGDGSEEFLP